MPKYAARPLWKTPSVDDPRWAVFGPDGKPVLVTVGGDDEKNARLAARALELLMKKRK